MKIRTVANPGVEAKGPSIATAQAGQNEREAEVMARVAKKVATVAPPAAAAVQAPASPREDLESIEFTLPNGMQVVFGPPKGISLTYRIIAMMNGIDTGVAHQRVLRSLLCVRSIDTVPVTINNDIDANALANRIGDGGIELLNFYLNEYWPPLRRNELPMLKKNQRV
jgi:hypothetical protein